MWKCHVWNHQVAWKVRSLCDSEALQCVRRMSFLCGGAAAFHCVHMLPGVTPSKWLETIPSSQQISHCAVLHEFPPPEPPTKPEDSQTKLTKPIPIYKYMILRHISIYLNIFQVISTPPQSVWGNWPWPSSAPVTSQQEIGLDRPALMSIREPCHSVSRCAYMACLSRT